MNRRVIFYFTVLFFLFFVFILNYQNGIKEYILSVSNEIKLSFIDRKERIKEFFYILDDNRMTSIELKRVKENNEKLNNRYMAVASELKSLIEALKTIDGYSLDLELVRTISYAKFGDIYKLWIDYADFNSSKIYGLLQNSFVAGIVIEKNSKPLALLNGDLECSYAVSIGENRVPGIVKNSRNDGSILEVNFIPSWVDIDIGDEVVTSGLDNIFYKGIAVGVVTKVLYSEGYKIAKVKPYANILNPDYFYIINLD